MFVDLNGKWCKKSEEHTFKKLNIQNTSHDIPNFSETFGINILNKTIF